jgi:hypothetical protein
VIVYQCLLVFINSMKRIKFIVGSLLSVLSLAPALAFAQLPPVSTQQGLSSFITWLQTLMGLIVPILIGLAIIVFLYGVLRFIFNAGDEAKRSEGKMFIIYGLIGIVIMVSVWGLVGFIQGTFGLNQVTGPSSNLPAVPR